MKRLLVLVGALALALPATADESDDLLRDLQGLQTSGPPSEAALRQLVDSTLPRVAKVMGLPAPAQLKVKVVSRAEARTKLLAVLHRDYPGDTLARLGQLLVAVGLATPGRDLATEAADLYGSNVSGFYDPHERVLFLLADQPLEAQSLIVAHELAHAVQDEAIGLDAAMDERRQSEDAALAFSAAIEGQAQEVASEVLAAELSEAGLDLDGVSDLLSEGTAASAGAAGAQAAVPWLGMQMSFPYAAGAHFIAAVKRPDDRTARFILRRLPSSTAQVLTPELYQRDQRPLAASVHLFEMLPGSLPVYSTTLGRANLDLFGQIHGGGSLGEGWEGDHAEVVRIKGRIASLWTVSFATPEEAKRLANALAAAFHAQVGVKAAQADGSSILVQTAGRVTALLEGLPDDSQAAIQKAALGAFDH